MVKKVVDGWGNDVIVSSPEDIVPLFVPYNGKIADITHADTNKHTLTLANAGGTGAIAGETRKIISLELMAERTGGTGGFAAYANEGVKVFYLDGWNAIKFVVIKDGTQRLQYALTVANDDWDLYCFGYVVEI
jgi:hypothetical protein